MKTKRITVVVSRPPDFPAAEKLRMAVGLTLEDGNKVSVLFIGEGALCVNGITLENNPSRIEMDKSAETLGLMGAQMFVHAPSLTKFSVAADIYNVSPVDDRGAADLVSGPDIVIT